MQGAGAFFISALLATSAWAHPGSEQFLQELDQRIQAAPNDASLLRKRGIHNSASGHYEEALSDFEQLDALGEGDSVRFDLAVLYYRMSRQRQSLLQFDQLLEKYPLHLQGLQYRSRLLRDRGDFEKALDDQLLFLKHSARVSGADFISAAELALKSQPDNHQLALSILDEGQQRLGSSALLQQRAVSIELARSKPDLAIDRLLTLESELSGSPAWHIQLAELLNQEGLGSRALNHIEQAKQLLENAKPTPAAKKLQVKLNSL